MQQRCAEVGGKELGVRMTCAKSLQYEQLVVWIGADDSDSSDRTTLGSLQPLRQAVDVSCQPIQIVDLRVAEGQISRDGRTARAARPGLEWQRRLVRRAVDPAQIVVRMQPGQIGPFFFSHHGGAGIELRSRTAEHFDD